MESQSKKKSAIEVKMQLLSDGLKTKEENGDNTDFSINITLADQPNKKVPVVERDNGFDKFESAMERAKNYSPVSILVHTYRNKSDRNGNLWSFNLAQENETDEKPLGEQIADTVKSEMIKVAEIENTENLGAIEKYEHLGEILTLKSEKQLTDLKHQHQLDDLNRQLTQKQSVIKGNEKVIADLEKENKNLVDDFDSYKADRLAGISKSISQAGLSIVSNLASQYLPQLLGSGNNAGMGGMSEGQKTTIVEDDDPRNLLIDQIRLIISEYDQQTFMGFYRLMELIAADKGTIDIILKYLEPQTENNETRGGAE